jgi:hypothetical protein
VYSIFGFISAIFGSDSPEEGKKLGLRKAATLRSPHNVNGSLERRSIQLRHCVYNCDLSIASMINDVTVVMETERMKQLIAVFLSFAFLSLCAFAQQPNALTNNQPKITEHEQGTCSGDHKPGDLLKCYIVFDGDPDLQNIYLTFQLQSPPAENQIGLERGFQLGQISKIGRGEYAIEGKVTDCIKGIYQLNYVSVIVRGVQRAYLFGGDFKDVIQLKVKNDVDLHFPKIKDISAQPPRAPAPTGLLPMVQ